MPAMMQRHLALFGDAVSDDALEFGTQWKHGAEDFADRSEIVVGDPTAEAQQCVVEHRGRVEDADHIFRGDRWLAVVEFGDDARHALLAERDEDASAHDRRAFRSYTVGKHHVERHGQGYVTEFGH